LQLLGELNLGAQKWQPHQLVPSGKNKEQLSVGLFGVQVSPEVPGGQMHALFVLSQEVFGLAQVMQLSLLST
jgi:hypothetical protein